MSALGVGLPISFALAAWLGHRLGARGRLAAPARRTAALVLGGCLFGLCARAVLSHAPATEVALFGIDLYASLRPWWASPLAVLALAIGASSIERRSERRGLWLLLFAVVVMFGMRLEASLRPKSIDVYSGRLDSSGVCLQTSSHSCGAAAAVMLLHHHALSREAGTEPRYAEWELADLCRTDAMTGTSVIQVLHGLGRVVERDDRFAGFEPRLVEAALDDLALPAMVTTRISPFVQHWIVALSVDPANGRVEVADPLSGRETWTADEYLSRVGGLAVVLQP